jgi:hypothetical protein
MLARLGGAKVYSRVKHSMQIVVNRGDRGEACIGVSKKKVMMRTFLRKT